MLPALARSMLLLLSLSVSQFAWAHAKHCEDTALGAAMVDLKKLEKKLKKQIQNEDFSALERTLQAMIVAGSRSLDETPLLIKHHQHLDDTARVEARAEYRQQMQHFVDQLKLMANAAKAKNLKQIASGQDKISEQRKQGHKEFRMECD